jgi:hypothetical protein
MYAVIISSSKAVTAALVDSVVDILSQVRCVLSIFASLLLRIRLWRICTVMCRDIPCRSHGIYCDMCLVEQAVLAMADRYISR